MFQILVFFSLSLLVLLLRCRLLFSFLFICCCSCFDRLFSLSFSPFISSTQFWFVQTKRLFLSFHFLISLFLLFRHNEWKRRRKTAIIAFKSRKLQVTDSIWLENNNKRKEKQKHKIHTEIMATAKTRPILINTRQQEAQSLRKRTHTLTKNRRLPNEITNIYAKLSLVKRIHVSRVNICKIASVHLHTTDGKKIGCLIVTGLMQYCQTIPQIKRTMREKNSEREKWKRKTNFPSWNVYWTTTNEYSAGYYN